MGIGARQFVIGLNLFIKTKVIFGDKQNTLKNTP